MSTVIRLDGFHGGLYQPDYQLRLYRNGNRRKPVAPKVSVDARLETLRSAQPAVILEHDAGDAEFVVLIARAMPGGHVGIVAKAADDAALVAKLADKAIPITS